jgi:glycosyltransferase involved in cell wall biosynthesis
VRLGVNGWRLHGALTGVGRYLSNVMRYWDEEAVAGRFERVTLYTPAPVDRETFRMPTTINEQVLSPHWRMLVWENLRLGPTVKDDVLFCPSFSRPLFARGRTVVTTFEATEKLHPEFYPWRGRVLYTPLHGWSARHASLVVTATETAKRDIVRAYGVPEERIRVVPLAPAELFWPVEDRAARETAARYLGAEAPYFLFVGKLTARRNVPLLMEAFAELKRRRPFPHKLLVVGLNTTQLDLGALAARVGIQADFRYVDYVPDEDLNLLYNGAEAFVMPYSYEALSLTALEAQAAGTPVITADAPGLREQTGGHAVFVPNVGVGEIAEAMERVAEDEALRNELVAKGLDHARRFTWERCSLDTLAVLAETATLVVHEERGAARHV